MKFRKYTAVLTVLLMLSIATFACARITVMHDDVGVFTGPALYSRYADLQALVTAVGAVNSTTIIVNEQLDMGAAAVTVTANITLDFTRQGAINATVAQTVTFAVGSTQIIASDNQRIFVGAGTFVIPAGSTLHTAWFGTDAVALTAAINASNGSMLIWKGTYLPIAGIDVTLTDAQEWIADGPVTIRWSDVANITNMVLVRVDGNPFTIKGPITFDGDSLAGVPLRINNTTATMATATDVKLIDVTAINAFSDIAAQGAAGILIVGGFDLVELVRPKIINVSRGLGVGTPGVVGSIGIGVSGPLITRYARQVVITDPIIENVTSLEADGDAVNNVDSDCLSVLGPDATAHPSGFKVDTVLDVRGGRFTNCRGRSIKSQMEYNIIDGPTFVRGGDGDKSIVNGMEVDFQYGSGILRNFKCIYSELTGLGGPNPFGGSFKIANATVAAHSATEGAFIVSGGLVVNDADATLYRMPYGFTLALGGNTFRLVVIENVTMLGVGRVGQFIRGVSLATLESLRVKGNYISNMTTALIYTTTDASNCMAEVTGNTLGIGAAVLVQALAGEVPEISGYQNTGFPVQYNSDVAGDLVEGEIFRIRRIMPVGSTQGGAIVTESEAVADDAVFTFSERNYQTGIGLYFISVNFNDKMQGVFAADDNTITDLAGGASTSIDYGNVADPDAGCTGGAILNVWIDAPTDSISIHNCIGSTRIITLVSIG